MKLSTKGRYAMVALADLALAPEDQLLSLAEISKRQDISLPYLEQLFVKLRRAGLVDSVRGPGGGYRLARPAETIRVADILAAVDETVSAMHTGAGASGGSSGSRAQSLTNRLLSFFQPALLVIDTAQIIKTLQSILVFRSNGDAPALDKIHEHCFRGFEVFHQHV